MPGSCRRPGSVRTLAIGNLTARGLKRILGISVRVRTSAGLLSGEAKHRDIKADIVSATDDQPTPPAPQPSGARRLGLSGKLLLLTIPLVMIALLMIYVPSIANFWTNRLNDRLAAANTAALVLDAAPLGMVPDSLARQILTSVGRARSPSRWGSSAECSPAPTCRRRSTATSTCGR